MKKETVFFTADNLALKHFQGVSDFKGRLNGECCLITGSEKAGKSNTIAAILMILKQYPSALVTQGEEDGKVSVEISRGETKYLFKFSFEEGDKTPSIKTLIEGEKVTMAKQSEIIKSLTPKTFNLDDLLSAKGQAQTDILLTAFGIDTSDEKEAYREAYDERTLAKRGLEDVSHFQVKEEVKEVDTKALREELDGINVGKELRRVAETKLEGYNERMEELEDEAKILNKKIDDLQESIKKGKAYLKEQPKAVDTTELEGRLSTAEVTNEQAREYREYLAKVETKKKKQITVQKWETKVKDSMKAIVDKINSAKLPVPKLSIKTDVTDAGRMSSKLTYDGLPFDASSINTGTRIAIAAKLQLSLFEPGNLAIVVVNAGSIGDATIQEISKECKKQGAQCLFELTSRSDKKPLSIETVFKG